jgi:hypothetical protein
MKSLIGQVCLGIAIAIMLPSMTTADTIVPAPPFKASVMLAIDSLSTQTGIPSSLVKNIVKNESGYDEDAIGDHGLAHNVAQFHQETFDQYEKLYFNATGRHLNYDSATDQITLMCWMFKNYPQSKDLWSTYRRIYGVHLKRTIKK